MTPQTIAGGERLASLCHSFLVKGLIVKVAAVTRFSGIPSSWAEPKAFLNRLYASLVRLRHGLPSSAKIHPNRFGEFECFSEVRRGTGISDGLIDVLHRLSADTVDIRNDLIFDGIQPQPDVAEMEEATVCQSVDIYISDIHWSKDATKWAQASRDIFWVYNNYMDQGNPKAKWFPEFRRSQANIVCDIIFDDETRSLVSVLARITKQDLQDLVAAPDHQAFLLSRIAAVEAQLRSLEEMLGASSK
jgi:hypothetical protein